MKMLPFRSLLAGILLLPAFLFAQSTPSALPGSLVKKSRHSLELGADYLIKKQRADGTWGRFVAVDALVALALYNNDQLAPDKACRAAVEKGRKSILKNVQSDGAICPKNRIYVNYSTAVCLSTLAIINNPEDLDIMRKARGYLLGQQLDAENPDKSVKPGDKNYGGFGYGKSKGLIGKVFGRNGDRADLSSTQWALEALYLTERLDQDTAEVKPGAAKEGKLAWDKAIHFLEHVQNIKKEGENGYAVTDGKDGGFTYLPDDKGDLKASYGSMTYAGMKSMLYAKLKKDDPRLVAAHGWVTQNYSVNENPGKGASGLFYYFQTMTKALSIWGDDQVTTADGTSHAWRQDLIRKLIGLQKPTGEWVNEASGRWQENDPRLVTAYAMISMQIALRPGLMSVMPLEKP